MSKEQRKSEVRCDLIDLRDAIYSPSLIDLPTELLPMPAIGECIGSTGRFIYEQELKGTSKNKRFAVLLRT